MPIFTRNKKRDEELGEDAPDFDAPSEHDAFEPPDEFSNIEVHSLDQVHDEPEEESPKKSKGKKPKGNRRNAVEEPEEEPEPEKVDWGSPVKPSLSLPSRAIIEAVDKAAAQQKMKKFFIISIAGLMAFGLTAFGLSFYSNGQLEGAKSEGRALDDAVSKLQPIADYSAGLQARKDAVSKVLAKDLDYTKIQSTVFSAADKNGVLVKSEDSKVTTPCSAASPFVLPTGIGCITLQVEAGNSAAISGFATDLVGDGKSGIPDAYITAVTTDANGRSTGTMSFNYDQRTISDRYRKFANSAPTSTTPATGTGTTSSSATPSAAPSTQGGK